MAWITLEVDTKTDEDDPTTLLGVPAAFEGSSCFAGVPPHERAWWRFWVPQDWVPPLRVEVRLPSGLLVIALPPAGSAGSYLRFSAPKSELVSQKRGPAKQDLPRSPARDLAHCAYCQRTDCQCPVKSQLGRRLSFSRRSSVRRVWLDDRGRGEWAKEQAEKSFEKALAATGLPARNPFEKQLAEEAMAKGKRPPTTSGSPLAAALTARSLRECESLAGPALNSTPLSAGPCGVTFRSRSVPPSVEAVTSSSQLGGVLSPGDVVAFISLGGETETACATMNGEDLAAALRAHAESGDRILHWIAGGRVAELLASVAEHEASLVTDMAAPSWEAPEGGSEPTTRVVLPSGKKATPNHLQLARIGAFGGWPSERG
mmetsp:Transcript_5224/g.16529  ORF Transcript_5224/g.16529 Transcript_5224/m.16529 type:complete len:373 (+) Transcript_5224:226-1344(+)